MFPIPYLQRRVKYQYIVVDFHMKQRRENSFCLAWDGGHSEFWAPIHMFLQWMLGAGRMIYD